MSDLIIGIVAGLLTGFIAWIVKEFLFPKFIGFANKVPNISGAWTLYDSAKNLDQPLSKLTIRQFGIRIHATSERIRSGRRFRFKGTFDSGILTLVFEEVGGEGYIVGATVLKLSSTRQVLEGQSTYYQHDSGKIINIPRYYKRENSS